MKKIVQTAGRTQLGKFAPEFAHLNDDILFGEVWSRNDLLSLRDRSLVTITSLISQGITDSSLKYHLQSAKNNGITRTEVAEIITHIAFYAGWPKAWAAFNLAKEVWNEDVKGEDAKAAGHEVEKIYPECHLAGTLFCGGVVAPRTIEGNKKLQEAYELGKSVKG